MEEKTDSKVGHFKAGICANDGHQLTEGTEEDSLGGETAQAKAQCCEKDEGTSQAGERVLIVMGLEEQPDLGRPGGPGPSHWTCRCCWHLGAIQWVKTEWLMGWKSKSDQNLLLSCH